MGAKVRQVIFADRKHVMGWAELVLLRVPTASSARAARIQAQGVHDA